MKRWSLGKVVFVAAGLLSLGLVAAAARAGVRQNTDVVVSSGGRYAYGSLGSARNSADTKQKIGCTTWAFANGTATVYCFATDAAGTTVNCSSSASALVNVVRGLNGDGYLYFNFDASNKCDEIDVDNRSHHPTKNH